MNGLAAGRACLNEYCDAHVGSKYSRELWLLCAEWKRCIAVEMCTA